MATPMFDTNWIPSTLLKAILFVEWLYSYPNSIARRSSKGRQIDLNEGFEVGVAVALLIWLQRSLL